MTRPGIVIVTYNSAAEIRACLDAACLHPADIVVVDNGSDDETVPVVREGPGVLLIDNTDNRGFAGAVNQGIETLSNDLVLLLNPDAVLTTPLDPLMAAFGDPTVGAAAGRLVDETGRVQAGFTVRRFPTPWTLAFETLGLNRLWPGNPVNRRYRCADLDLAVPAAVEQPAGAFLMIRRDAWIELGGFDTAFHPLWFEDVDYLFRLRSRGWQVRYEPASVAKHSGGHSIHALPEGYRQRYWYGSLLKYASKHFGPAGHRLVCVTVILGSIVRMFASALRELSWAPIEVYGAVMRLASRSFFKMPARDAGRSLTGTAR